VPAIVVAALAGCGTNERFAPGVSDVADATKKIDAEIERLLAPDFATALAEQTRQAALGSDLWVASPECLQLAEVSATPALSACRIDKTTFGDRAPPPNLAADIARKSGALTAYVDALDILTNATSEEELFAALAVAQVSFRDLGRTSDTGLLDGFVADIDMNQERIETFGAAAFDALRFRKLQEVVTASDADVAAVVSEIQIGLLALGKDPAFLSRSLRLQQANGMVQAMRGQGEIAVSAYQELEAAHADFVDNYDASLIGRVGLVAQAHGGLVAALKRPDSPEEIVAYLEALRGLSDFIEE